MCVYTNLQYNFLNLNFQITKDKVNIVFVIFKAVGIVLQILELVKHSTNLAT